MKKNKPEIFSYHYFIQTNCILLYNCQEAEFICSLRDVWVNCYHWNCLLMLRIPLLQSVLSMRRFFFVWNEIYFFLTVSWSVIVSLCLSNSCSNKMGDTCWGCKQQQKEKKTTDVIHMAVIHSPAALHPLLPWVRQDFSGSDWVHVYSVSQWVQSPQPSNLLVLPFIKVCATCMQYPTSVFVFRLNHSMCKIWKCAS